ncbi:hypothetical protein Salat_1250800 [Sesamum alatum]|uniref:Uncharacterized protein n=1 Tax=Sesamum alatum TaxID=300844 RepID=A0AAE1YG93_9LAMI|nr:hypothetical protein Salat_1250800 [Sesamum alatum]
MSTEPSASESSKALNPPIENQMTLFPSYKPTLIPAVDECLSAYEEIAGYMTYVISDASQESAIAGLDGEVIQDYISRCIKALAKTKEPEIADRNKEARNYAKLLIDIADNLGTRKPK